MKGKKSTEIFSDKRPNNILWKWRKLQSKRNKTEISLEEKEEMDRKRDAEKKREREKMGRASKKKYGKILKTQ